VIFVAYPKQKNESSVSSFLFLLELLTGHEPERMGLATFEAVWP